MLLKLVLGLVVFTAISQGATAATVTFIVPLDGQQEVPGPGDPNGTGSATLMIDDATNTISWTIQVSNLDPVIAAHIHTGAVGVPGAPLVDFSGQLSGSGLVDADLAAVLANPTLFYVNVHTTTYINGAIRGQIGAPVAEPATLSLLAAAVSSFALARRRR